MANFDQELDATGLNCPLPILRAKKALATLTTGTTFHARVCSLAPVLRNSVRHEICERTVIGSSGV